MSEADYPVNPSGIASRLRDKGPKWVLLILLISLGWNIIYVVEEM